MRFIQNLVTTICMLLKAKNINRW